MKEIQSQKEALLREWQELRQEIDKIFYFAEEEDFMKKGADKNSWNVKEVLYHINLLNRHFLDQLENLNFQGEAQKDKLSSSFYGRSLMKTMPKESRGQSKRKYPSPKKVDPRRKQAQGYAIVEKVIFADMLADLEAIKRYIENLGQSRLHEIKVKGLIPFLKLYGHEAIAIMIRHERRHIAQAERILKA